MTDHIVLRGVSAFGHHGVLDFEKAEGQTFVVDLDLTVDLARAAKSDDLTHTVSYADVAAETVRIIGTGSLDLIETLASRIADAALRHAVVEVAQVTVHKPQAPVGVPFNDVAVSVRRERDVPVVIALGANLGDSAATLASAVVRLATAPGVRVTAVSPLFETDPVGGPEQPAYLNAVLLARTSRAPHPLLRLLHAVEAEHGRVRETRWGARTLDVDLVQYGDPDAGTDVVSDDPEVTLPHPRAAERAFVLEPWLAADHAARLRVAGDVRDVADLVDGTDRDGIRPGPPWHPAW